MKASDTVKTVYEVSQLLDWQRAGKLELSPSFQRREVWRKQGKSFLIDTIVRNFPIPPILLRKKTTNLTALESKYEVVDGQQRLRTILTFVDPKSFPDFSEEHDSFTVLSYHNAKIAGKKFADLPVSARKSILDYQLVVHVLPSHTEDSEILEIFSRLNSTGMRLNAQELRNAEYVGEFKTVVYKLAAEQLSRWRGWEIFNESKLARMAEAELTSECLMLIAEGITAKNQQTINKAYEKWESKFPNRKEIEKRFRTVMDEIDRGFGSLIANSEFRSAVLFYPLFAAVYDQLYGFELPHSAVKPKSIKKSWFDALQKKGVALAARSIPPRVADALKGQTNKLDNRKALYSYLVS